MLLCVPCPHSPAGVDVLGSGIRGFGDPSLAVCPAHLFQLFLTQGTGQGWGDKGSSAPWAWGSPKAGSWGWAAALALFVCCYLSLTLKTRSKLHWEDELG